MFLINKDCNEPLWNLRVSVSPSLSPRGLYSEGCVFFTITNARSILVWIPKDHGKLIPPVRPRHEVQLPFNKEFKTRKSE